MKTLLTSTSIALCAVFLLTGCIGLQIGGDKKAVEPTTGQQLIDLKKARDCGAMTETEYQAQRAKLVGK